MNDPTRDTRKHAIDVDNPPRSLRGLADRLTGASRNLPQTADADKAWDELLDAKSDLMGVAAEVQALQAQLGRIAFVLQSGRRTRMANAVLDVQRRLDGVNGYVFPGEEPSL